jgi:hypothetical protein
MDYPFFLHSCSAQWSHATVAGGEAPLSFLLLGITYVTYKAACLKYEFIRHRWDIQY